jgi:hypothetical protein
MDYDLEIVYMWTQEKGRKSILDLLMHPSYSTQFSLITHLEIHAAH